MESKDGGEPKNSLFNKFVFLSFGISSLLAWNTILTDIGFFIQYQSAYNVDVLYPFLANILSFVLQLIMLLRGKSPNYKTSLLIGVIGSIFILVSLPFTVLLFEPNSKQGFILSASIIFFMGFISAICNNGYFGLASYFPNENRVILSTGQGMSGIIPNIINYIIVTLVNTGDKEKDLKIGTLIFFFISSGIYLLCLILTFMAFKTDYFKYYLKDFLKPEQEKPLLTKSDEPKEKASFMEFLNKVKGIGLLIVYIYIITFAVFPSVCISQNLFNLGIYRIVTIITLYNIFDTLGRSACSKVERSQKLTYFVCLSRTIVVILLPLNFAFDKIYKFDINITSIILILLVGFLGFTNGMASTLCFDILPSLVSDEEKGKAGSSNGVFTVGGIVLGTCVGFCSSKVMNLIANYGTKKI